MCVCVCVCMYIGGRVILYGLTGFGIRKWRQLSKDRDTWRRLIGKVKIREEFMQ